MQIAPHYSGKDREQDADHEGNAPAPGPQFFGRQEYLLQQQQHNDGGELAADQGDVLKA